MCVFGDLSDHLLTLNIVPREKMLRYELDRFFIRSSHIKNYVRLCLNLHLFGTWKCFTCSVNKSMAVIGTTSVVFGAFSCLHFQMDAMGDRSRCK